MNEEFSLEDAIIILRRRIWYFLIPVLVIAPVGAAIVMAMPSQYEAQGRILVESQQIPDDLIRSTITAYAQERIETIRQRVTTLNHVIEIANKYEIFPPGSRLSETERAKKMRSRLTISSISVDRRSRASDGTIAFTVSYKDRDAEKAYLVANEFMTLFLAEDVRTRTAGASNTTEFFQREANKLREQVAAIDERITKFKSENADALPEHQQMHLDMLERANRNLLETQRASEQLQEEKQFLESQLISGSSSTTGLGAQLEALQAQLATLRATYHEDYPEIKAVRDEIAALRRQMAPSAEIRRRQDALADAEAELNALERADELDPDAIAAAETKVDAARVALSDQISAESRANPGNAGDAQTEARIAVIENRLRMNERRKTSLTKQIDDLQDQISRTPAVERQLTSLMREFEGAEDELKDLTSKQQEAKLAESLEENQQAEKFSILEPAAKPDRATSPDRIKLIILVLFAALSAGGGVAMLAELLFATVRGRAHISNILGEHPIAVVPYIPVEGEKRSMLNFRKNDGDGLHPAPEAV